MRMFFFVFCKRLLQTPSYLCETPVFVQQRRRRGTLGRERRFEWRSVLLEVFRLHQQTGSSCFCPLSSFDCPPQQVSCFGSICFLFCLLLAYFIFVFCSHFRFWSLVLEIINGVFELRRLLLEAFGLHEQNGSLFFPPSPFH